MSSDKVIPVKVALRIRPLFPKEKADSCCDCLLKVDGAPQVIFGKDKLFTYDYVFSQNTTQTEVYDTAVVPLVNSLFKGYNVTVLAYGQTGSGKTYTMGSCSNLNLDSDDNSGIIPRVLNDIFKKINDNSNKNIKYNVKVSYIEVYNDDVKDLLTSKQPGELPLIIREENSSIKVVNLTEISVNNVATTKRLLQKGSSARSVGGTAMNDQSSRSHAIFTVTVEQLNEGDNSLIKSKFHLVDLAGSERLSKTQAEGIRLQEGININLGLLALGNVICALGEDSNGSKNKHVPYRQSKLTRLLQDSLGRNSHTLMIACVSPADSSMEETLNTLRYADRARKIKNRPIVNIDPQAAELASLRIQVQELKAKLYELTSESTKNSVDLPKKNEKPTLHVNLSDENSRLITELSDKEYIIDGLRAKLYDKCQKIEKLEEDMKLAEEENQKFKKEIEKFTARLIEANQLVNNLETEISCKNEAIKELENKLQSTCDENQRLEDELKDVISHFKTENSNKDDKIKILNNTIQTLTKDNTDNESYNQKLKQEYEDYVCESEKRTMELKSKTTELIEIYENDLKKKELVIDELKTKLNSEIAKHEEQCIELNWKIYFSDLERQNLDRKLKDYETIVEESKKRAVEYNNLREKAFNYDNLVQKLEQLDFDNAELEEKLNECLKEKQEIQQETYILNNQLETLKDQVAQLKNKDLNQQEDLKRMEETEKELESKSDLLKSKENEILKLKEEKSSIQMQVNELSKTFTQYKLQAEEEYDQLNNTNALQKNEISLLNARLKTLNTDFLKTFKNFNEMINQNRKFKNEIKRNKHEHEKIVTKLQNELKSKELRINELERHSNSQHQSYPTQNTSSDSELEFNVNITKNGKLKYMLTKSENNLVFDNLEDLQLTRNDIANVVRNLQDKCKILNERINLMTTKQKF